MKDPQPRRPRAGPRAWLQALGSAGSLVSLLLAWPAFLLLAPRGAPGARGWELLWIGFFALLAIPAVLALDGLGLLWVAMQCGVGYLVCRLFTAPIGIVGPALVAAVVAIVVGVEVESSIYDRTWKPSGQHLREEIEWSTLWGVDRVGRHATYRLWNLPEGAEALNLSFDAKRVEGESGWSWRRSTGDVGVSQARGSDVIAARLDLPSDGDPWAARDYGVGSTVGAVRATLDLRGSAVGSGRLYLVADGEPVHEERVAVHDEWERVAVTWQPEEAVRPDVVTVMLNDFDGQTLFARNVDVEVADGGSAAQGEEGAWRELGPPRQARATVTLGRVDGETTIARSSFLPTPEWKNVRATFDHPQLGSLDAVRTELRLESETAIAVRDVRLEDAASGAAARARSPTARQQLWHGHPNLLGHGVAVSGLVMAAVLPMGRMGVVGVGVAAVAAAYTGGRASLVVLVGGALVLWWIRLPGRPRLRALIAILLVAMAAAGAAYILVAGEAREEAGQAPRTVIASVALEAIERAPWTGIGRGPDAFQEVWDDMEVPYAPVVHAHNWWLHYGVVHGLAGVVAATWFSIVLLGIGWRAGRWRGAGLVAVVFGLQVFDVTLLHWAVLSPLVLALNALARDRARIDAVRPLENADA